MAFHPWITTKRVLRSGFIQFWRSSFVSISSIFVLVVTLSVILSIMLSRELLVRTLDDVRSKVDINVYFVSEADEVSVMAIKDKLEALPEVAEVTYISEEEALAAFKDRNQGDSTILQSLEEIGENPLGAVLNVRAVQPDQYETIAEYLKGDAVLSSQGTAIIDTVNYYDNKTAIDRLTRILSASERFGFGLMAALIALSVIVTFNTIRLAIYISRDEISVMRLVGASNKYIRGPFVVAGIIAGLVAAFITLVFFYPIVYWLGQEASGFLGINLFEYYITNFLMILGLIILSGIVIGGLSSWLAVRKYLR